MLALDDDSQHDDGRLEREVGDPDQWLREGSGHESDTTSSDSDAESGADAVAVNDPISGTPAFHLDTRHGDDGTLPLSNANTLIQRLEDEIEARCSEVSNYHGPLITHGHWHRQYFRSHRYKFIDRSRHYHINHVHHHHYHHHRNHYYYYPSYYYNGFNGNGNVQILRHRPRPTPTAPNLGLNHPHQTFAAAAVVGQG